MVKSSANKLATARRKQWQQILQQPGELKNLGEPLNLRVFLDTNIWYSAIVYGGTPEKAVRYCLANHGTVSSHYALDELKEVLRVQVKAPSIWRRRLIALLEKRLIVVDVDNIQDVVRDPKDNPIVAAAEAASCGLIVSGDRDLLELKTYKGIAIITATEYLNRYAQA